MNPISFHPIGTIHSPFKDVAGMPIQPAGAKGVRGKIEVFPEFVPGLKDLDGFSHLILIYFFHRVESYTLEIRPFLDEFKHGVFATRAPRRPNPIGLSTVRLECIDGAILYISDLDFMNETPLLDIKPYVPEFDNRYQAKIGWLTGNVDQVTQHKSDNRFNEKENGFT